MLSVALAAIGNAKQDQKETKPAKVHATVVDPSQLPRTDDADARKKADLQRNGGEASYAYLRFKQEAAAREILRWPWTFPNVNHKASVIAPVTSTLMSWTPIGPSVLHGNSPSPADLVSGRPTAIVTHPTNPNILYMAVAGSGVWKCTNADPASTTDWIWTNITDALPSSSTLGNISVGDLVMDPAHPETLYLGMGDPLSVWATGFFITHDGGATWTQGGALKDTVAIQKIILLDTNTLLVISVGSYTSGIFRSSDGGASFTNVALPAPLSGTNFQAKTGAAFSVSDVVVSGIAWDETARVNFPAWITSSDGGQTWARASVPATFTPSGATSPHNLDINSTPNVVAGLGGKGYALVADQTTSKIAKGLYVTTDYGATWSFQDSPTLWSMSSTSTGEDGGQSWYNLLLTVDPSDSRKVFAAAQFASYRSLDGGLNWEQLTHCYGDRRVYAHADFHVAAWSKTGPKALYMGNDGGLAILRDPYRTSIPSGAGSVASDTTFLDHTRNKGIQSQLAYTITSTTASTPPDAIDRVALGMQDNNTGIRSGFGGGMAASTSYEFFGTGDGYGVLFHPLDGTRLIAASYMDLIFKTSDLSSAGMGSWTSTQLSGSPTYPTPIVPIRSDPTGNSVLTSTNEALYTSADFGTTWKALPMPGTDPHMFVWGIAASPTNPQAFAFVGTQGHYTANGGISWNLFGAFPSSATSSAILASGISIGAADQSLYAFDLASVHERVQSHIWKSIDKGLTWVALDGSASVSNGFPFGIPARFLRESLADPSTLYAGTDFGLYASQNAGVTWSRFGMGLPMVQVTDMYEAPDGSFLRVATYGRGAWEIRLTPAVISLTLGPARTHMGTSVALPFTATVVNATNMGITWSASSGSLSATSGSTVTFTAPATPGPITLTVTSVQDPTRKASWAIQITSLDLDSDGSLGVLDLARFAQAFTGAGVRGAMNYLAAADLDGDGDVDNDDVALFFLQL